MTNINSENLTSIIEAYKVYFKEYFSFEIYKWKAVEYFQTYWNIEAVNFKGMLVQAFSKTKNLLSSMNRMWVMSYLPRKAADASSDEV